VLTANWPKRQIYRYQIASISANRKGLIWPFPPTNYDQEGRRDDGAFLQSEATGITNFLENDGTLEACSRPSFY
jgi:hypothetical protein